MKLLDILLKIVENPHIPRFYKELHVHYNKNNQQNEADAIRHLIKMKFNDKTDDNNISS